MSAADAIEAELRALADSAYAERTRRYLKTPETLEHLGLSVPAVRAVMAPHADAVSGGTALIALTRELWLRPVFELRLVAALTLDRRVALMRASDLAVVRHFLRSAETWALVDPLAYDMLGRLLLLHRTWAPRLDKWTDDPDFWVRRAALLSQGRPLQAGGSFDRFAGYADGMLDESEFFIRKAIGWVLREMGKTRPGEVHAWLLPRADRASGVTVREAVKHLGAAQREEITDRYRETHRSVARGAQRGPDTGDAG